MRTLLGKPSINHCSQPCLGPTLLWKLSRNITERCISRLLFRGFIPRALGERNKDATFATFDQGMLWQRAREFGITDSCYNISYSMKLSHIERMLSHGEWITQFEPNNPAACRRALLHPSLPFRLNDTERIVRWLSLSYGLASKGPIFDPRG